MPLAEGDLIEIDADTAVGREQHGRRPALIVSVDALQTALGLAVVCAVTTHGGKALRARNELEVSIPAELPVKGVVSAPAAHDRPLSTKRCKALCGASCDPARGSGAPEAAARPLKSTPCSARRTVFVARLRAWPRTKASLGC